MASELPSPKGDLAPQEPAVASAPEAGSVDVKQSDQPAPADSTNPPSTPSQPTTQNKRRSSPYVSRSHANSQAAADSSSPNPAARTTSPGGPHPKRGPRKHQHTVSFGSPLAQQIVTPNKPSSTSPSQSNSRSHHRRQDSSTSSTANGPSSTSAQHLALIQQRYAADQHTVQQQQALEQQLAALPPSSNPRYRGSNPRNDLARGMPAAGGYGGVGGGDVASAPSDRRYSEIQADLAQKLQAAQALQLELQRQQEQQQHQQHQQQPQASPVVPTVQNVTQLHPADVQQTNNALAQQLAMLTLMNELKKHEVQGSANAHPSQHDAASGNIGLGLGLGSGGGTETLMEAWPGADKSNAAAGMQGPRADPLYNPGRTSNVYINNLPAAFTEAHLYQLCAGFGPIISVRMMLRDTGTCYGFVLFEAIDTAESCIMWLRQFSDVHPSFARTPLKTVPRPSLDNTQPPSQFVTPQKTQNQNLASPFHYTGTPHSAQSQHARAQDLAIHHPHLAMSTTPFPAVASNYSLPNSTPTSDPNMLAAAVSTSATKKSAGAAANGDVRPAAGRVGSLGLQQLFPQRDPVAISAVVSNVASVGATGGAAPYTPPPAAAAHLHRQAGLTGVSAGSGTGSSPVKAGEPIGPSLFVDGLPNNIDLPSLEALFSPHHVVSARFFRPTSAAGESVRIVAIIRLSSLAAAEESIEKLHGRVIPGWTPPGTKLTVSFAEQEHQGQLSLSEQRLQSIIAHHTEAPASPLERKSTTAPRNTPLSNYGSPANHHPSAYGHQHHLSGGPGMRYTSNLGSVNESQGSPRNPAGSYVINLPHQKHPQFAEYQEPRMQRQRAHSSSTTIDGDGDSHMRSHPSSTSSPAAPPRNYKVPHNTPAKYPTASQNSGPTSPRYVVQLPASLLNQKRPNLAGPAAADEKDEKTDTESPSEAGGATAAIPAPKFHMPPPSLFKAAPTRAPLVIRPPPGQPQVQAEVPQSRVHKEVAEAKSPELELHTPELTEDTQHEEQSPTTTLGSGTPATISGQFTPAMSDSATTSAGFSPEIKASKMLPTIELPRVHEQGYGHGKDASGKVAVEQEHVGLLQPPVRIVEDDIL